MKLMLLVCILWHWPKKWFVFVLLTRPFCVSSIYQWNCWAVCFRAASTQSCFASPWQHWTVRVSSSVVWFWSVWPTCSAGSLCPQASHPPCWHLFSILHVLVVIFTQRPRQDPSSPPTLPLLMGILTLGQCYQHQMVEGEMDSKVRATRWIVPDSVYSPWPVSMNWCQRTVCQWILRSTCCACSSRPSFFCRGWHGKIMLIQSRAAYRNLMRGMAQTTGVCVCVYWLGWISVSVRNLQLVIFTFATLKSHSQSQVVLWYFLIVISQTLIVCHTTASYTAPYRHVPQLCQMFLCISL